MNCPKCLSFMAAVKFEEVEVEPSVLNCRGLWFDMLEEERLSEIDGSEVVDDGSPEVGASYNDFRDFDCPRCRTPLIKIVHPEQTHLQLEACKVCNGVFFDAGEFTDSKFETIKDLLRYYFRKLGS